MLGNSVTHHPRHTPPIRRYKPWPQVLEILHKFEDTPEGLVTTLTYMDGLVHEKTPLLNILSNKLLADMLRELCFDDFLNAGASGGGCLTASRKSPHPHS